MADFLLFWLAKYLVELAIPALIFFVFLLAMIPGTIHQMRCRHDRSVRETSSCDAICNDCHKNLGFIDAWRKQNVGKEPS